MSGIIGGAGRSGVIGQIHGGIKECDVWRETSGMTGGQTIASNWERVDTDAEGKIGIGFSAPSSGVFTFPRTGVWRVDFGMRGYYNGDSRYCEGFIYVNEDIAGGASYAAASYASTFVQQTNSSHTTFGAYCSHLMNVSDTTNIKVRFDVGAYDSSVSFNGDTNYNLTYAVFTRIGDSY